MTEKYASFRNVPEDEWHWRHFSPMEIACTHCDSIIVVPEALDRLEAVRVLYGKPIILASAYRCALHPEEVAKKTGPGSHTTGTAFDPYPAGRGDLAAMLDAFYQVGVLGRGMGLRNGKMHIHFDWDKTRGSRAWGY